MVEGGGLREEVEVEKILNPGRRGTLWQNVCTVLKASGLIYEEPLG